MTNFQLAALIANSYAIALLFVDDAMKRRYCLFVGMAFGVVSLAGAIHG